MGNVYHAHISSTLDDGIEAALTYHLHDRFFLGPIRDMRYVLSIAAGKTEVRSHLESYILEHSGCGFVSGLLEWREKTNSLRSIAIKRRLHSIVPGGP